MTMGFTNARGTPVAPHAGAWIETVTAPETHASESESRPTRARGLKRQIRSVRRQRPVVAPHAGAWIETMARSLIAGGIFRSRPTRARGLKHCFKA